MPESTRPVVMRGGTVLTLDAAHTVLTGADLLVVDDRIAAIGPDLAAPEVPTTKVLDNPYTYTDYRSAATHQVGASGS